MLTIRSANRRGNRATPPQKIVQQKISPGCGSMTMKCKCRTLTKRFTLSTRHIGVGAGNFLDAQNMSCPNSANLPEKRLCDKHSCCRLSVAIGTLSFHLTCCHRLENLVLEIWFYQTEKTTLGYARRSLAQCSWGSLTVLRFSIHCYGQFESRCDCFFADWRHQACLATQRIKGSSVVFVRKGRKLICCKGSRPIYCFFLCKGERLLYCIYVVKQRFPNFFWSRAICGP